MSTEMGSSKVYKLSILYRNSVWPELLLCAIMWNVAFFSVHLTNSVWILSQALLSIPLFCFLLVKIMLFSRNPSKKLIWVGATWGALCLGAQTAWFVILHLRFPSYYGPKLLLVWLVAIAMFALLGALFACSALWICFGAKKIISRRAKFDLGTKASFVLFFFITTILWHPFHWYLENASFWPTKKLLGYPLFSPFLPLESATDSNFGRYDWQSSVEFKWIEPKSYKESLLVNKTISFSPFLAGLEIARSIVHAQNQASKDAKDQVFIGSSGKNTVNAKPLILMAPESTFPFFINDHQELVDLWAECLEPGNIFLIGAYRSQDQKLYQCTAVITSNGLQQLLDKKRLTPFAESRFTPGANAQELNTINIQPEKALVSLICFEFFTNPKVLKNIPQGQVPVVFGNDTWFPRYLKVLLRNFAKKAARTNKTPIIYLSHELGLCLGVDK